MNIHQEEPKTTNDLLDRMEQVLRIANRVSILFHKAWARHARCLASNGIFETSI